MKTNSCHKISLFLVLVRELNTDYHVYHYSCRRQNVLETSTQLHAFCSLELLRAPKLKQMESHVMSRTRKVFYPMNAAHQLRSRVAGLMIDVTSHPELSIRLIGNVNSGDMVGRGLKYRNLKLTVLTFYRTDINFIPDRCHLQYSQHRNFHRTDGKLCRRQQIQPLLPPLA
jgi:hypothetical protein